MSETDDFCGCGSWACGECQGSDVVPGSDKNSWEHGDPPSAPYDECGCGLWICRQCRPENFRTQEPSA